jgi:DAK2 domain fusion protein YloV
LANSDGVLLTVPQARSVLTAGFRALEERKQEINDLNVYPVPDGDTGTNLVLTMRGILDAVERLPDGLREPDLCAAVSQAALMGARGNSGVILSQIVRGAMEVLGEGEPVTCEVLARALRHATETAYRAVRRPVEGTILTVLREMAEAAAVAPGDVDRPTFMGEVVAAGWRSVERTPSLLKVLADAGVVDAGGFGLVVLVQGATDGRTDWEPPIATQVARTPVMAPGFPEEEIEEQSRFTYCTSFLLTGEGLDQALLEEQLSELGDSLLVVGDQSRLKVHVHTDDPGHVLGLATSLGILSEIEIDNMKEQTAARLQRLSQTSDTAVADPGLTQVVAVVVGEGNKTLFRNLGVDLIVEGGQSMNPSAEDLIRAVDKAAAPSVVVLPNNSNVIMTAEHTIGLASKEVHVVPTKSIQAGLTAAVSYDRRLSGAENAREMEAAIENVLTAEVTRAVRDSLVDGVRISTGDFIGLLDGRVVVADGDLEAVLEQVAARLAAGDRELLTLLVGDDENAPRVTAMVDRLRALHPTLEIEVHDGGQPFYPVLLSAE